MKSHWSFVVFLVSIGLLTNRLVMAQDPPTIDDGCALPSMRHVIQMSDTSRVDFVVDSLKISYSRDSLMGILHPIISESGMNIIYTEYLNVISVPGRSILIWTSKDGSINRVLQRNYDECSVKDIYFSRGEVMEVFNCTYDTPNQCIFITYQNGIPLYFSECRPSIFRSEIDTVFSYNREHEVDVINRGFYDEQGNKHLR